MIDNRGGAGGNIAADLTAKSAPDGYTLMMGTIGTHAINYSLYSKLPYHPVRDFTPIALVGDSPNVLVTSPRVQVNTVKEFIALARASAMDRPRERRADLAAIWGSPGIRVFDDTIQPGTYRVSTRNWIVDSIRELAEGTEPKGGR